MDFNKVLALLPDDSDAESTASTRAQRSVRSPPSRPHPYGGTNSMPKAQLRPKAQAESTASTRARHHGPTASDWASGLREVLADQIERAGEQQRPLVLESTCSGMCTEAFALKEVGIVRHAHRYSVDPKRSAFEFARGDGHAEHHFERLRDLTGTHAKCWVHNRLCDIPASTRADLHCSGVSCKPFSAFRRGRFQKGSVENHDESVLFSEFLQHILRTLPYCFVIENVVGWNMRESDEVETTCLQKHLGALHTTGLYQAQVFKLNLLPWVQANRPRLYMVGLHTDVLASSHAAGVWDKLESSLRECLQKLRSYPAQLASDFVMQPSHPMFGEKQRRQLMAKEAGVAPEVRAGHGGGRGAWMGVLLGAQWGKGRGGGPSGRTAEGWSEGSLEGY